MTSKRFNLILTSKQNTVLLNCANSDQSVLNDHKEHRNMQPAKKMKCHLKSSSLSLEMLTEYFNIHLKIYDERSEIIVL